MCSSTGGDQGAGTRQEAGGGETTETEGFIDFPETATSRGENGQVSPPRSEFVAVAGSQTGAKENPKMYIQIIFISNRNLSIFCLFLFFFLTK